MSFMPSKSHFVLVDCNNFYVSCERLFNPKLENCPVIVLSNNDGCVVARSAEAKQLNIKMGDPFFKIKNFCLHRGIKVYSSNYQLYGDISQRIMTILSDLAPEIQVYSIDEAFLSYPVPLVEGILFSECINMRQLIKKWVGIPTSIGIGPSKTLAKVANSLAKKDRKLGVFDLSNQTTQQTVLKDYPIEDVWGIGSQTKAKLNALGIYTAGEFCEADVSFIRRTLGVVGERIYWELKGTSCLPLEEAKPKQSISCSRSFGKVVTEESEIAEALATFANTACIKLREQNSCVNALCIYTEAVLDQSAGTRRHFSTVIPFISPTQDTSEVISAAKKGLHKVFFQGNNYKKCGVILLDLVPEATVQPDLFLGKNDPKRSHLMETIDSLNSHFGKNTLFFGAMGINPKWKVRADRRSNCYTTSWHSLAIAKA